MDDIHRRLNRLRYVTLILTMVVVFAAAAAPIYVVRYNQRQAAQTQLAVVCTSARANVEQLGALNEIADRLGIPHTFKVPEVPPECNGS